MRRYALVMIAALLFVAAGQSEGASKNSSTVELLPEAFGRLAGRYQNCGMNNDFELRARLREVLADRVTPSSIMLAIRRLEAEAERVRGAPCNHSSITTSHEVIDLLLKDMAK